MRRDQSDILQTLVLKVQCPVQHGENALGGNIRRYTDVRVPARRVSQGENLVMDH